jgi:type I restriction-modification system DNA methylase subunit
VLEDIRVVDPACGSGAFLVHVFDFLMSEYQRIGKITGDLFSTEAYVKQILRNNIYGVDLNEESVEITKLSLWLTSATKNEKLTSLDDDILCGNSLISESLVAGSKADTARSTIAITKSLDPLVIADVPYSSVSADNWTPLISTNRLMLSQASKFSMISDHLKAIIRRLSMRPAR